MLAVQSDRILTPLDIINKGRILIENGKVVAIGPASDINIPDSTPILDAGDKIIIPGLIDTHTHGRDGDYYGEDSTSTAEHSRSITSTGVTSFLPTLASLNAVPDTLEVILNRIKTVRQVMIQDPGGAEILGIHMEGPFLSKEDTARGSQQVDSLRDPSVDELHQMVKASEGTIRKMSIAPELEGAIDVVRELVKNNIIPSAAHSTATYDQVKESVVAGLSCATHAFNGMIPFHHRRPGFLGAVLTSDEINAELIADGQHVCAVAMQVLLRCKGIDGIHLITDNTIWAGLPDGTYDDGNRTVVKENHKAVVVGGTLVGSVASLNFCVRNFIESTNCTLQQAVQLASLNPARVIGVDDRKGSLEIGKDADLVLIDENVDVYLTMVKGKEVFRSGKW